MVKFRDIKFWSTSICLMSIVNFLLADFTMVNIAFRFQNGSVFTLDWVLNKNFSLFFQSPQTPADACRRLAVPSSNPLVPWNSPQLVKKDWCSGLPSLRIYRRDLWYIGSSANLPTSGEKSSVPWHPLLYVIAGFFCAYFMPTYSSN